MKLILHKVGYYC